MRWTTGSRRGDEFQKGTSGNSKGWLERGIRGFDPVSHESAPFISAIPYGRVLFGRRTIVGLIDAPGRTERTLRCSLSVNEPVFAIQILALRRAKSLNCQSRAMATADTPAAATKSTVALAHGACAFHASTS